MQNILIVVDMQNGFARYDQTKNVGKKIINLLEMNIFDYVIATKFVNKKNGPYKDLIDFCERIQGETVNKKCIECLIKAGTFDDFKETRKTLLASFEGIINTIINEGKRS